MGLPRTIKMTIQKMYIVKQVFKLTKNFSEFLNILRANP